MPHAMWKLDSISHNSWEFDSYLQPIKLSQIEPDDQYIH